MKNDTEVLVDVNNVSKKFCKSLKRSLWYGVNDITNEMLGRGRKTSLRTDEFWAVSDISFQLKRGECLGLIGHNGAGKSTLLKMLNGLIKPDTGRIEMRGRVGALIELGTGFNPILTGKENVYNNAAVLGFSKEEVDEKFDEILEFSEIGDFIDSPVQNYSSGMKVRLGFAVAAQLEPDILLIDEVLAVGDMKFKLKCFNKIDELASKASIIFVSHTIPQISRLCDTLLLMEKGKRKYYGGDVATGIDLYYNSVEIPQNTFTRSEEVYIEDFKIESLEVLNGIPVVNWREDLNMSFRLVIHRRFINAVISISVFDKEQRPVGICQDKHPINEKTVQSIKGEFNEYSISLSIPGIILSQGLYFVSLMINEEFRSKPLLRMQSFQSFQVKSETSVWPPIQFDGKWK